MLLRVLLANTFYSRFFCSASILVSFEPPSDFPALLLATLVFFFGKAFPGTHAELSLLLLLLLFVVSSLINFELTFSLELPELPCLTG